MHAVTPEQAASFYEHYFATSVSPDMGQAVNNWAVGLPPNYCSKQNIQAFLAGPKMAELKSALAPVMSLIDTSSGSEEALFHELLRYSLVARTAAQKGKADRIKIDSSKVMIDGNKALIPKSAYGVYVTSYDVTYPNPAPDTLAVLKHDGQKWKIDLEQELSSQVLNLDCP
ncbi:hypothetical protein [Arthrobacter sp.]|uniref:hypothetical protein n=1 Tax=Arthrobacter sp. TaxID=1667 RepID=UPI003392AFBA